MDPVAALKIFVAVIMTAVEADAMLWSISRIRWPSIATSASSPARTGQPDATEASVVLPKGRIALHLPGAFVWTKVTPLIKREGKKIVSYHAKGCFAVSFWASTSRILGSPVIARRMAVFVAS